MIAPTYSSTSNIRQNCSFTFKTDSLRKKNESICRVQHTNRDCSTAHQSERCREQDTDCNETLRYLSISSYPGSDILPIQVTYKKQGFHLHRNLTGPPVTSMPHASLQPPGCGATRGQSNRHHAQGHQNPREDHVASIECISNSRIL